MRDRIVILRQSLYLAFPYPDRRPDCSGKRNAVFPIHRSISACQHHRQIVVIIDRQLILFSVNHKMTLIDAITASSDHRAEKAGVIHNFS